MARLRLGVALLLPTPAAEEVDGLRRALGDRSLGRVPPHLTLVPPVNVRHDELGQALAVLRAAAAETPRQLTVTLGPPTSFLPENPVVYLPVLSPPALSSPVLSSPVPSSPAVFPRGAGGRVGDAVGALRQRVWQPPLTRTLSWPFVAHVTLADAAEPERIEAAVAALADYTAVVTFERVHLLMEHRPGPRWRPLADAAFGPAAVVAGGPLAVTLVRSQTTDPEARALLDAEGVDLGLPDALLAHPVIVTARREGGVVGVAAGWLAPDGLRSAVFVATAHRRQGIGRHLHAALRAAADEAGWCGEPGTNAPG